MPILNNATNIRYGDISVKRVYCGNKLVWGESEYTRLEYFDTQGLYCLNTHLRPSSGALGFEGKVVMTSLTWRNYDCCLLGGFNSDPFNLRDECTTALFTLSRGALMLEQWHGVYDRLLTNDGTVVVGDTLIFSGYAASGTLELTLNGTTVTSASGSTVLARDVWIARNGNKVNGTQQGCNAKIYYMKLYDGATLARDLVPVRRNSDGVYGMLDMLDDTFYEFEL